MYNNILIGNKLSVDYLWGSCLTQAWAHEHMHSCLSESCLTEATSVTTLTMVFFIILTPRLTHVAPQSSWRHPPFNNCRAQPTFEHMCFVWNYGIWPKYSSGIYILSQVQHVVSFRGLRPSESLIRELPDHFADSLYHACSNSSKLYYIPSRSLQSSSTTITPPLRKTSISRLDLFHPLHLMYVISCLSMFPRPRRFSEG